MINSVTSSIRLSNHQLAVIEFATQNPKSSLVVDSCAGAAKTTTLVATAHSIADQGRLIALAFNKSIATELAQRLPANAITSTMNSLGHRALGDFLGKRVTVKDSKLWEFWRDSSAYFTTLDQEIQRDIISCYTRIKLAGLGFKEPKGLPKFTPASERCPATEFEHGLEYEGLLNLDNAELAAALPLVWELDIRASFQEGIIQFLDQIYLPACFHSIGLNPYQTVIVDEAQDLSPLDHVLINRLVSKFPAGRVIAFGDKGQAIYGFRGADYDSFGKLQALFNAHSLDLPVSFRCPTAVVAEAAKIDPRIQPWSEAIEGHVVSLDYNWETQYPADSVVLCRNNAPLIKLAITCIKELQGVEFLGRDLANTLIKYMARHAKGANSPSGLWVALANAGNEIESKALKARHRDYTDCFYAISEWKQATSLEHIVEGIKEIFERRGSLQLCTVHRSKGLEWHNVFLLRPDLIPSKYANTPEEIQQETNLLYVAITRAQFSFTYLNSGEQ